MKKIRIKQVKSGIDRPLRQKKTLVALGFKHLNQELVKDATPQVLGMVEKVKHLVTIVEEIN